MSVDCSHWLTTWLSNCRHFDGIGTHTSSRPSIIWFCIYKKKINWLSIFFHILINWFLFFPFQFLFDHFFFTLHCHRLISFHFLFLDTISVFFHFFFISLTLFLFLLSSSSFSHLSSYSSPLPLFLFESHSLPVFIVGPLRFTFEFGPRPQLRALNFQYRVDEDWISNIELILTLT